MTLTRDEVLAGLERLSRGFMTPSITDKQSWLEIDGTHGITFLPESDALNEYFNFLREYQGAMHRFGEDLPNGEDYEQWIRESLADYYEGTGEVG